MKASVIDLDTGLSFQLEHLYILKVSILKRNQTTGKKFSLG